MQLTPMKSTEDVNDKEVVTMYLKYRTLRGGSYIFILLFLSLLLFLFALGSHEAKAGQQTLSILSETGESRIADIAEQRINGVVNISSTKVIKTNNQQFMHPFFNDPFFRDFFGHRFYGIPREKRERSLGSGVIVSADGLVLTNSHVVENAQEIVVTLADEREFEASIVGTDTKSDLAVIKLKGDLTALEPVPIGNSSELRLGDIVLAIGNPFGLEHTVTMGIVSAKGRANVGITDYEDFIQTDAAINPGNSGGALLNLNGELIGINTAILSRSGGYQGIGFAIPSNMAKAVMESLVKYGKVVRGWLGVSTQDLDQDLAEAMKLKDTKGVLITDIIEDGPAAQAGIVRGDVIRKLNGDVMSSTGRLRNTIAALGAGSNVAITIVRDGAEQTINVTLEKLPDDFIGQTTLEKNEGALGGLTVSPLSDLVREKFEIKQGMKSGLVITKVEQNSPAERIGLEPGDVILEINRQDVTTSEQFAEQYRKSEGNILLLINRKGRNYYVSLNN